MKPRVYSLKRYTRLMNHSKTRQETGMTQINKIRNESAEVTTGNTKIQRIVRKYYDKLFLTLLL